MLPTSAHSCLFGKYEGVDSKPFSRYLKGYADTVFGICYPAIILIWMVLLLFYRDFAGFLNSNSEIVDFSEKAMAIFIAPYILLALNLVIGSIFYREGENPVSGISGYNYKCDKAITVIKKRSKI